MKQILEVCCWEFGGFINAWRDGRFLEHVASEVGPCYTSFFVVLEIAYDCLILRLQLRYIATHSLKILAICSTPTSRSCQLSKRCTAIVSVSSKSLTISTPHFSSQSMTRCPFTPSSSPLPLPSPSSSPSSSHSYPSSSNSPSLPYRYLRTAQKTPPAPQLAQQC